MNSSSPMDLPATPVGTHWGDPELDRTADGLILVVGCPRSGTSLMHTILLSHPDMTMPPETHLLTSLHRFNGFTREPGEAGLMDEVLQHLANEAYLKSLDLDESLFLRYVQAAPATWAGIFLAWLTAYRRQKGALRIGEKTPRHYLYFDYFMQHFPSALVIFLLRDPRAVFNSYRKMALGQGNIYSGCRTWLEAEGVLRHLPNTAYADRVMMVRYEELVDDPASIIQAVCAFVHIPFNPSMLEPHKREERGYTDVHHAHWENTLKPIFSGSKEAWRSELSARQKAMIDYVDAEAMARWGFEPTGARTLGPRAQWLLSRWVYRRSPLLRRLLRNLFG